MANLYADENFPRPVVLLLRALGHDVHTVQEAGRQGHDDLTVLADATAAGRAVVTSNRRDFILLHRQLGGGHAGIIVCCKDHDFARLAQRSHAAILAAGTLARQLLRIDPPPQSSQATSPP